MEWARKELTESYIYPKDKSVIVDKELGHNFQIFFKIEIYPEFLCTSLAWIFM